MAESFTELQQNASGWYNELSRFGTKVSIDKIEVIVASAKEAQVLLNGNVLKQASSFKYLGRLKEDT